MEGQIPGGVPGIFPCVGHGNHVGIIQMYPAGVATSAALRRRRRLGGISFEPHGNVVMIGLLVPQQPRECLSLYAKSIGGYVLTRAARAIKFVGLANPIGTYLVQLTRKRR